MSQPQRVWREKRKVIRSITAIVAIPTPANPFRSLCFDLCHTCNVGAGSACRRRFHAVHSNFDRFISAVVAINIGLMLTEHYNQPQLMTDYLTKIYHVFLAVYFIEMFIKVCAFGRAYFQDKWNWFDALLLLASLVFFPFEVASSSSKLSDALRLARLLRIGRLVRIARHSKGLRMLLNTLIMSVPALCNISLLLFLILFCYAIVAVELFSDVVGSQSGPGLSRYAQFDSFPSALLTLFRMSTGEDWNVIMHDVSDQYPFSSIFFICFLYVVVYLMFNLYMSAIIQNFSNICNQASVGNGMLITDGVIESFRLKWLAYDPSGSNFIQKRDLTKFLLGLDFPLRPFVSPSDRLWLNVSNRLPSPLCYAAEPPPCRAPFHQ
jgi:hypothetical protein